MNGWMREGEKYLQSSTYNKYTANQGSKQNAVVRETRERQIRKSERRRDGENFYYLRETKTERKHRRVNKRKQQQEKGVEILTNKFAWSPKQLSRHV